LHTSESIKIDIQEYLVELEFYGICEIFTRRFEPL
jgi:hypothetical protein